MELSPFVDSLRRDLAAAAGAVGGTGPSGEVPDEVRAASERLLFALDPSVRLVLLDALGSAAAEVGAQLDDAAVEVRLRGRDPELVVLRTDPPAAPAPPGPQGWVGDVTAAFDAASAAFGSAFPGAPVPPVPPTPPVPPEAPDEDGTARLTLRLPESLKARAEAAAAASGLSVNAWLVRAVAAAVDGPAAPPPRRLPPPGPSPQRVGPVSAHPPATQAFGPQQPAPQTLAIQPLVTQTLDPRTLTEEPDMDPSSLTFPVDGPVQLDVRSGSGTVTLRAHDTSAVVVDVRPADGSVRSAEAAAATVVRRVQDVFVVHVPRSTGFLGRDGSVDVTLSVPTGSSAEVSSRSGDVRTSGELDRLTVSSGSGDVLVDRVRGRARATTGSGDVGLGEVGSAQVRSGSGTVRVRAVDGPLEVGTGSGDVTAGPVGGDVLVQTGSGDVELASTSADVTVTTGSGDVVVGAAASGQVALKTASGDVSVTVPDGTAVLLDCSSVSGRLSSDLRAAGEPGPDERRLLLRARTVSGDLVVRRG